MATLNINQLKQQSADRLRFTSSNPAKLVLLYTGVTVALSLSVNGLNLLLSQQISSTGGLGGLGARSVLQTIQTLLSYFATFFSPFWQAGFLYSMISLARNLDTGPKSLLRGFQRFGQILGYVFWQMMITMTVSFGLIYLTSFLFVLTPFAAEFMKILTPLLESGEILLADGTINMDVLPMDELLRAMIPMLLLYAALMIPAYGLISYHLRLTSFLLLEGPRRGTFASMIVSSKMMQGHKLQMLKLDLSFWWYYALEALLTVVLYLDLILPALGVALPMDETAAYFLTLALYGVLEIGLHLWKKAYVDVTYACAFDTIYQEFAAKYLR